MNRNPFDDFDETVQSIESSKETSASGNPFDDEDQWDPSESMESTNPFGDADLNPFSDADETGQGSVAPTNPSRPITIPKISLKGPKTTGGIGINSPSSVVLKPILRPLLILGYSYASIIEQVQKVGSNVTKETVLAGLVREVRLKPDTSSIWQPVLFIRVVSWLPNNRDETTNDVFTGYVLNIQVTKSDIAWRVVRRFSLFQELYKTLWKLIPKDYTARMLNAFPVATFTSFLQGIDDAGRNERASKLNLWFHELCSTANMMGMEEVHSRVCEFVEAEPMLVGVSTSALVGPTSALKSRRFEDARVR